MRRLVLVLTVSAFLGTTAASAHHSFARYYFEDQMISIAGEVVEFEYRSPHAWLYVMAEDDAGQVRRFAAEWASPGRLARQGITKDTLEPGDFVIVMGSPGRVPTEYKLHLKGIRRPADGWNWRGGQRR